MSTPKDGICSFLIQPPFIEFDMSQEGFSCLFLPSIAPVSVGGSSQGGATNLLTGAIVGNSEAPVSVNGGIGTGERQFPPQSGLTFSTWICIEKCSSSDDSHHVRLLTVYRAAPSGQEFACLQVIISARDKALLLSTQEMPIFSETDHTGQNFPKNADSDYYHRIWTPELIQEDQWHHVAIVLNRALLKNSTITVYVDGQQIAHQKLHYIASNVGGQPGISNTNPQYINGFIGTPPQWRRQSKLIWKQVWLKKILFNNFKGFLLFFLF